MRPLSAHSGLRGPALNLCDIMQRGYLPQVPLLVNLGANLEARDATGRTPLMLTAYVQPEEWGVGVARLLIEVGVRMSHRDKYGMNALHHAAIYERLELAKVLLNAPDFDLAQTDKFGNTALHYAAMSGNVALVKLLVSHHHRYRLPLNKLNRQSRTPRDEALRFGHHACAAILDDTTEAPGSKDDNQSESQRSGTVFAVPTENNTNIFVTEEAKAGVCSDDADKMVVNEEPVVKVAVGEESKMVVVGEEAKSSPTREDDGGGLFPRCDAASQEEMVKKLMSPHQSPQTSDRSSDSKARSSDSCSRSRKSGIRRAQTAAAGAASSTRRMSVGSDASSSRSGGSARKQPLLSVRNNNNNNNNAENGNHSVQYGSENETVKISNIGKPLRSSSGLRPRRRSSGLSEKTNNILNASETAPLAPSFNEPSSKAFPVTRALPREPTFISRSSSRLLLPYEKDPERIIHVAPETDFRNTPEYVLKLTRLEFNASNFDTDSLPVLVRRPETPQYDDQASTRKPNGAGSWRDNMRFLFRHYEYQCSPSWRNAAKPPPDPMQLSPQFGLCSAQGDEVDGDGSSMKEKKFRRPSSSNRPGSQMNDISTGSSSVARRRPVSSKQRKISTTSGSPPSGVNRTGGVQDRGHGDTGADNVTASSSESSSTATPARKRSEIRPDQGAASNGTMSLRNNSKTSVDNGKGSAAAENNNGGASAGNGSSSITQDRNRRLGSSNSYTVPALTVEALATDSDEESNNVNGETTEVDNNRLTVLSDISED